MGRGWIVVLAALGGCSSRTLTLEVAARERFGPVEGSLQTGRGGAPGTSSAGRPTLDEIGVSVAHEPGAEVVVAVGRHEVALDAAALFLHGDRKLAQTLVTQGETYLSGTTVESRTWIGFARAEYRYRFDLPLGGGDCIQVRPSAGATAFQLHYDLEGSNGRSADRSYSQVAPEVGLALEWRPRGRGPLRFSAAAHQSLWFLLPDDKQTDILEAFFRVHYDFSRSVSAHLETGWRHFEFEDDQALPNHPEVDFGPWIGLGLALRL